MNCLLDGVSVNTPFEILLWPMDSTIYLHTGKDIFLTYSVHLNYYLALSWHFQM